LLARRVPGMDELETLRFPTIVAGFNPGAPMPKFVIERKLPGAGKMSQGDLQGVAQKSCGVLREMGSRIQWQESYVTDDKIYCVYIADSADDVREHAKKGGFPADSVEAVRAVIDPVTADA
jgi:hypothetical protein